MRDLLACGSDANSTNVFGRTVLWLAARWGHIECVQTPLDAGADVDIVDRHGETARFASETAMVAAATSNAVDRHSAIYRLLAAHGRIAAEAGDGKPRSAAMAVTENEIGRL